MRDRCLLAGLLVEIAPHDVLRSRRRTGPLRDRAALPKPRRPARSPPPGAIPARGKGQVSLSTARAANCRSLQKRSPPEIPRIRQVTAIHAQGDTTARAAAFCREPSAGNLINGRTDIDVMMLTEILVVGACPGCPDGERSRAPDQHNPTSIMTIRGSICQDQHPGCGHDVPIRQHPGPPGRHGNAGPSSIMISAAEAPAGYRAGPDEDGGGDAWPRSWGFPHSIMIAPPPWWSTAGSSPRPRRSGSPASSTTRRSRRGRSRIACGRPGCRPATWTTWRSTTSR